MTDHIGLVYAEPKLNYRDLSNQVWSMMKTRQENDVTDHIGVFYSKNITELL